MSANDLVHQSRRERQIIDILLRRGEATVAEVLAELPDAPSYSSVRALLGILRRKGRVTYTVNGNAYVYRPTASKTALRREALKHLVATFFGGSAEEAAAALLALPDASLEEAARRRIARRIASARRGGR